MPKTLFAIFAACVAALALASGVALANRLSVDDQDFRVVWNPLSHAAVGLSTIECDVTLSGSFHSATIAKTPGALIGQITNASVDQSTCVGGSLTVLTETLPWHVRYESFTGNLPSIEGLGLDIVGWSSAFATELATCLARTTTTERAVITANVGGGGVISTMTADEGAVIDSNDTAGIFCDFVGVDYTYSGIGSLEDTTGNSVVLRLIGEDVVSRALLRPSVESLVVTEEEASDRFTLTNDGTATATIDRTVLVGVDAERPEISVSAPGCDSSTIVEGASCVYTVVANDQALSGARVVIHYDDGNSGNRFSSVNVEVRRDPDLGLTADPSAVTIEELQQNNTFVVRNEGDSVATVSRVAVTAADPSTPEFAVSSPGCSSTVDPDESCSYIVTVNARPEAAGRVTVYYRDAGGERTLVVDVDIAARRPANLRAEPSSVIIERLESNDSFAIRNIGEGTLAATIRRITVVSADSERPEFSVTGPGCPLLVLDEASCTYIVSVNSRPEPTGRIVFEYEDGTGTTRRTTVEVDIAS